jgi:hypothetical protein
VAAEAQDDWSLVLDLGHAVVDAFSAERLEKARGRLECLKVEAASTLAGAALEDRLRTLERAMALVDKDADLLHQFAHNSGVVVLKGRTYHSHWEEGTDAHGAAFC